jgi:glycerate-2-kinase
LDLIEEDHALRVNATDSSETSRVASTTLAPSATHPVFRASYTSLVGNNAVAVQAAAEAAVNLGYHPVVLSTQMSGEASQVAPLLVSMANYLQATTVEPTTPASSAASRDTSYRMVPTLPAALILGGETTVTLPPNCRGVGGRNQEMALQGAASMHALGMRNVVMACIGTDGGDGPTDAAGAIVDGSLVERLGGWERASDALQRHDAYPYLAQNDTEGWSALHKTGPTGTNVADVCVILVHERGAES